jgi:hypothetical protein
VTFGSKLSAFGRTGVGCLRYAQCKPRQSMWGMTKLGGQIADN